MSCYSLPTDDRDQRLTMKELQSLFGSQLPMEVVNLIYNNPEGLSLRQIRERLKNMAHDYAYKKAAYDCYKIMFPGADVSLEDEDIINIAGVLIMHFEGRLK